MATLTGSPQRLRPHLKTSKMPEVVRCYIEAGVETFKCATLAEMRMALESGATDVLLAYQPVGPNCDRLSQLIEAHPAARLGVVVDCPEIVDILAKTCPQVGIWIDLDCGMHRTGIAPGAGAAELHARILRSTLRFEGWHVYDGHLHHSDLTERHLAILKAFAPVWAMLEAIETNPVVIAGGTPSFPIHAQDPRVICSPGTVVFWDAGYNESLPDMEFENAAFVLTRVISKRGQQVTLDLGHKAVAAENPIERRVRFPAIPEAVFVSQSEEHLVIQTKLDHDLSIGDMLLGIPWHICPTVALYDEAITIENDSITGTWFIARGR